MSYAHHKLFSWSLPQLLLLPLTYLWLFAPPTGVSATLCRVTGGVLGIHWSSTISLGWHPLADGRGGATCWEACCLNPSCNAVWSLGGRCVLLSCTRERGCPIASLPVPHQESLGLLQMLSKGPVLTRRRRAHPAQNVGSHTTHSRKPTSTESPKLETAHLTPTVPITLLQTAQKNLSQSANGSADTAPAPSQQNSTEDTVDTAASSNSSDVSTSTAPAIITAPTQAVRELVVSAGESVEVTLPRNEVELNAFVVPTSAGTNYAFDWRLITHPKDYSGEMEGKHSTTLKLSKLTVGLYEFEVTVDGDGAHGEGYVNVTVKPEPRVNKPPVAVVSPMFQEISLPISSTVIDGSQSTDDDKVVAWHWEEVKGPLREEKVSADTPVLTLTSLVPGNYTFSLTVTDSDGATDSTQATLSVNKAKDYRPTANAGPNQVIQLPRNSISLYGNQSIDDHDNLSYEWSLSPKSKDKVVEMQGVRTPILQLSAMQEGDYTFQLTVTDSSGQQDTAQVTVIVQPENNKPPVANAGPEKELTLPVDRTTLDGSKSSDDQKITTYSWKQLKGPDGVKIENASSAVATVTGLEVGVYEFTLTVTDERKLQSSDTVTVIVREELDQPPVAHVVSSPSISLPTRTATLDGSHSIDDKGGVIYLWTRDDSSPAAGDVLNNSDHQAVLFLGNLVEGKYSFTLTVTDSKGQTSTNRGSVEVKPDIWARDLVELVLEVSVSQVSHRQRDMLLRQVGVLLGVLDSDIIVREISAFNEHSTRLVFLVSGGPGRPPLSGRSVALGLRNKLRKQKNDFLIYKARRVDTVICQLNCSGHGECDSFTRRCVCHPFWMENFIRAQLGDAESNCEWSVLYVTIASFMIVVAIATFVWGMVCCCNRRKNKVRRSKSRYKMLEADEQDRLELQPPRATRLKPVTAPTSSALMHSDSDLGTRWIMDQSDNDLQGSDGSGSLGGPDVRRRIPIKLISKQPLRSKPQPRAQRPSNRPSKSEAGEDDNFGFKQDERFDCGAKSGDVFGSQRRYPQPLFWDYKLNLIGERDEVPIHFCDKCGLPIQLYGRMIPCKHVFCYDCAFLHEKKGEKMCPGLTIYNCTDPVQRIEQCQRGSLYMCSVVPGCKRTYLSQRDLQAHVNHRHMRQAKSSTGRQEPVHLPPASDVPDRFRVPPPHLTKNHVHLPNPLQHSSHDPYSQPPPPSGHEAPPPASALGPETFRISTVTTRKHSNLITVPIQDDSSSSRESHSGGPGPGQPPHHHPGEYPGQPPVVSHSHHMMAPPQQHFGPPPPPPPPISHPMQHPPQGSGTPHMVYNQAPPPPMSTAPPPITPPPGHIMGQMPPYMNHPPPGPPPQHSGPPVNAPPPHHYNPNSMQQFPEDQGTLSPPFSQPGGLSPGMWPAPRGPPPPRMQGPPPQGQMPGPHHPDQGRYRPYYQ